MATAKKRSTRIPTIISVILTLITLVAGYAYSKGWFKKDDTIKIATEKAEYRKIIETITASGKIYPVVEVNIAPDVSGEIIDLLVEEGDSVTKGQLLARINPDTYQAMVEQGEATVNASQSNEANASARIEQGQAAIKQLQVQLENTKRTLARNQQLFKEGVIAKADLETTETAVQQIEAQIKGAQADLKALSQTVQGASYNTQSTKASLKQARDNLNRTNVYAPMSGIISKLNVKKGERVVGTSQFAGTEMLRIADFKAMETRVDVSENDIVHVHLNDTAYIEVDAYPDRKFIGLVTQIASSANSSALSAATDQITNFTVKIQLMPSSYMDLLKKNTLPFRPGMSCSADIQTKTIPKTLCVPIQAVTTREDSLKKHQLQQETANTTTNALKELVFVWQSDNTVLSREVSVGIQDETYIEVLSGLKEGEEIVAAPYKAISKDLKDSLKVEKVSKEILYKKEE